MRGWAAAGCLALAVASAAPAAAADLNLLFTSSFNLTEGTTGGQSASQHSFVQSLDTGYNRDLTPQLKFRLRFLGSDNESTTSQASTSINTTTRFIEPKADMTWTGPKYSFDGGVRLRNTFVSGSEAQPLTLTEDQEFLRAFFTPDLLPAFTLQLDRTATTDDRTPATLDRSITRGVFGATYILAQKLNLAYTFTDQTNQDNVANRTQEQRSHVASANYADTFFTDRLLVNGNYLFSRLDTTETFHAVTAAAPGGAVLLPVVISRAFGLIEFDPTVANQSKLPPVQCSPAAPPCVSLSGATSTALGITSNLVVNAPGPPNNNESIIFGLTPGTSVSTVRLTVSSRPGDVRDIGVQAQGVTFLVLAGTGPNVDLTAWTQVPITSLTPPNAVNPYFEISFTATSATFLKIYVSGDTQQPLFQPLVATTIEGFISGAAAAGAGSITNRLTTGNTLQSVTGGITARPIDALTLTANGTFSSNTQDPVGRTDNNGTYFFTATGTPHRLLTATGTYQASFTTSSDPQTPRTDQRFGSLTLSSVPLPTLAASLSGTWSENEVGGVRQTQTTSLSFNTAAKPYRNLNVDLTTTTSRSENFVEGSKTSTFGGTLNANSTLTDRLTGLFGVTLTNSETTGGIAPSSVTAASSFLSLTYTISRFLNLNGRWDLSESSSTYNLTQQYRLDVIPTAKTSILVTFLRTDRWGAAPLATTTGVVVTPSSTPSTSGSTTTATVQGRWNISRYLDLNATTSTTWNSTGDTVYSIFATLAFRL